MMQALARLIRKHGPLVVLEEIERVCWERAEHCGEAGKQCRCQLRELGFGSASRWRQVARELRRAVGVLRRDEPDSLPAERGRK